jgi:hypothetical protein
MTTPSSISSILSNLGTTTSPTSSFSL